MHLPIRPLITFALRWVGLRTFVSWLRRWPWIPFRSAPGDSCLERSLADLRSLTRAGIPAALVIGVKRRGGKILAHAWIEVPGQRIEEFDGFRRLGAI